MPNYQNGKIYEIVNDETDEKYIGSTTILLCKRMAQHRAYYKKYLKDGIKYYTSCNILKYDSAKIVLIENSPCNSKEELLARERYWIVNSKCVNKKIPCRTNKEYYEDNKEVKKEYLKEYYQDNKEKIKDQQKKYYEENKEKFKEKFKETSKEYRENNKEKIKEKSKIYYEDNKEKIKEKKSEKTTCECGCEITRNCLSKHKKTKKHINLMKIKNQ